MASPWSRCCRRFAFPIAWCSEEDEIERAIKDVYTWSYAAYYHSAVVLGGEVVR